MSMEFMIGQAIGDLRARQDGTERKVALICDAQKATRKITSDQDQRITVIERRQRLLLGALTLTASWAANFLSNDGLKLIQQLFEHLKS